MRVEVTPGLLQWARERAGVDAATLTQRFPRLAEWESGDARPTLKQLEQFARAPRLLLPGGTASRDDSDPRRPNGP
jgi:hypothetical protein